MVIPALLFPLYSLPLPFLIPSSLSSPPFSSPSPALPFPLPLEVGL